MSENEAIDIAIAFVKNELEVAVDYNNVRFLPRGSLPLEECNLWVIRFDGIVDGASWPYMVNVDDDTREGSFF